MNKQLERYAFRVEMSVDTPIQYLQENHTLARSEKHLTQFLLTVFAEDLDDAHYQAKCCMNNEYSCANSITYLEDFYG